MAAALVGGAFLSSFVNVLFDRLASREFLDLFRGKESILKLLKDLETRLNSAAKLLNDAEEKLIKDRRVKKWLDDLKDTVYAADDLVYKIDTEALRKKQEGESQSSIASKVLTKLNPFASFNQFDKAIKPEIEEILEKLKLLLDQKTNLGLENVENKKLPERLIAPLVEESDVYGRDADKEAIVKLLLSGDASGKNLSLIPIVGMGGIGKTTLAQLVYNDEIVNKSFDTKAWITMGDDKVDCKKVMKIIIQKVTDSKECENEELYDLQVKLKKVLTGKKFLFVLDDVWDEEPHKWDVLRSSFKSGLHGSTILVTTRSTNVASIMKTGSIHQLTRLSNDDGWRLFAKHASIDVGYSDLEGIGRQIVDKCNGLPLAIKSLGAVLCGTRNKEEWDNILNIGLWELYERKRISILPSLWLSYHYLPSHLKPCFAYCAMFPKDYKFKKEVMISLWMAEGFLYHDGGKRSMEEVGEEYFQDLTSRSFFQSEDKYESTNFLMHDLMHDLAIFISGNLINLRRLHISYSIKEMPLQIDDSQKKREILGALRPHTNLKSLRINSYKGTSFPDWVGDELYSNLVEVFLSDCENCCLLPSFGQLPSLKSLIIWGFPGVVSIGLEFYYSSDVVGSPKPKPFRSLEALKFRNMSNLQEWWFIQGNELDDGVFPCLKELILIQCKRLKVLLPDFLPSLRKLYIEECQLLEPLVPRAKQMDIAFPSLERLYITDCKGQEYFLKGGLPSSLRRVEIRDCDKLEAFQRLTSLEKLFIDRCDKLRSLPRALPTCLSHLGIHGCDMLTPRVERETGEDWPIIQNIPNLDIDKRTRTQISERVSMLVRISAMVFINSDNK